ncbi:hypothetical protein Ccrd_006190 [Cynara cardunculus var. scolymus]|uniref:Uncharacterized protein n=1 Tax=Cynara cardunculus var. scolymus TaxID=59895 RepID=A0A124SBU9_CYNCS|nr:hypothetical protein Ccrd_006190 [Cynara cardunculus var. scolymus]
MESKNISSDVNDLRSPSNYNEFLLRHSLLFADGLKSLRTCQAYADHGGLIHQSLMMETPKYRKKYLLPEGCISEDVKAKQVKGRSSGLRNGYSGQASTELPSGLITFSFTKSASRKGVATIRGLEISFLVSTKREHKRYRSLL